MKEYIKLFDGLNAANGYEINDIPFTSTIRSASGESDINLVCNKPDASILIEDGKPRILTEVTITGTWNPSVSDKNTKVIISGNVDLCGKTDCYSIEFATGGHLTINGGAKLRVWEGGVINSSSVNDLTIQANSAANSYGDFLLHPSIASNRNPYGIVQFTTYAHQISATPDYKWERLVSPLAEVSAIAYSSSSIVGTYGGAFTGSICEWDYANNSWSSPLSNITRVTTFKGYILTNNATNEGVRYNFKGRILCSNSVDLVFPTQGYVYFGNSFSSAIKTAALFELTTQNGLGLYLWDRNINQYVEITSSSINDYPYIQKMETFVLDTSQSSQSSITLSYADLVWNPSFEKESTPTRSLAKGAAPKSEPSDMPAIKEPNIDGAEFTSIMAEENIPTR